MRKPFETQLEPDLRCIRADNPSPLTGGGTNTYILGQDALCVIDPGPNCDQHLARLLDSIGPDLARLKVILVTHSHLDHSPLARKLSAATGAPVLAFGDATAGRSAIMQQLSDKGVAGGGEGVDIGFVPDKTIGDGEQIMLGDTPIRAVWTPGHYGNHLCFVWRGAVFSGDHVMGWASSLVSPPDGDLSEYMASLDKIDAISARILYPGHGAPVTDPAGRISELRSHRQAREAAILRELAKAPRIIEALVTIIYADTPPALHPAAARNVFAHLVDLWGRGRVQAKPELSAGAEFSLL